MQCFAYGEFHTYDVLMTVFFLFRNVKIPIDNPAQMSAVDCASAIAFSPYLATVGVISHVRTMTVKVTPTPASHD